MKKKIIIKRKKNKYNNLLKDIGQTIETARKNTFKTINTELVKANWEIGRHIVEFEQQGNERAEYGSDLLSNLSRDLKILYGKGFGRRNVLDMRRFYLRGVLKIKILIISGLKQENEKLNCVHL
jgi:hypothetical protein